VASTKVLMVLGMVAVEVVVVGVVVVVVVVVFVVCCCCCVWNILRPTYSSFWLKDKCDLVRDYFSKNAPGICSQRDGSGFFF